MNEFVNRLREESTMTRTENGALTHSTTMKAVVDFFAMGGSLRSREGKEKISMFTKAFSEDQVYALKCLFYIRDVRGGIGERDTFRTIMAYMVENHYDRVKDLIPLIPEYGRWDDLINLIGISDKVDAQVAEIVARQLAKDQESDTPSLLAKWMPSENASSKYTKQLALKLMSLLGIEAKFYRKNLSSLRKKIGIVEHNLTEKNYKEINYEHVPSKATIKYRKAFRENDSDRYEAYLQAVDKGEAKINTATTYPSDIVASYMESGWGFNTKPLDKTLETAWKNLPNYVQEGDNAIVVADVSGSMSGVPITVSVALATYFAERNKGPFADHFITFSERPTMQKLQGSNLKEKIDNLCNAHWSMNTDLQAVFNLVLNTAIKSRASQSDMPKSIYIISDMEFDSACYGNNKTNFQVIQEKYKQAGYEMPQLVFWNVASRQDNVPVKYDTRGVTLVSGYSPTVFQYVVEGTTPEEFMKKVLDQDRYKQIE
jgi:hypothetical protein